MLDGGLPSKGVARAPGTGAGHDHFRRKPDIHILGTVWPISVKLGGLVASHILMASNASSDRTDSTCARAHPFSVSLERLGRLRSNLARAK